MNTTLFVWIGETVQKAVTDYATVGLDPIEERTSGMRYRGSFTFTSELWLAYFRLAPSPITLALDFMELVKGRLYE